MTGHPRLSIVNLLNCCKNKLKWQVYFILFDCLQLQVALGMNLASLRYDLLFDYGDELQHINATRIVKRHSHRLDGYTATVIESRNRKRYQANHLPYPYLVPGWIANSIHT